MTWREWWYGGGDLAQRADELADRVAELEAQVAQLLTSLELQRSLIRSLRDVNADLDRRLA